MSIKKSHFVSFLLFKYSQIIILLLLLFCTQLAQAALTSNVTTPWVQSTYNVTASSARSPNILCTPLTCPTISNLTNVTDANLTNYASIDFPVLGVLAYAEIGVKEASISYPAGTFAGFRIEKVGGLLDAGLFDNITVTTYLGGVARQTVSGSSLVDASLLGLIGSGSSGPFNIGFWTAQSFDEVRFKISQPVGLSLGGETRVYSALLEQAGAGPALACNADQGTSWTKPAYPVRINSTRTGLSGVCVGCEVTGASNIIDSDGSNYATINILAGLLATGSISVEDPITTSYPAGSFAGFSVEDTGGLGLGLLNALTLTTYLNGIQQESKGGGDLLDLPLFVGKHVVSFQTSLPFNEVRLTAASLLGVNTHIRVYETVLAPSGCFDTYLNQPPIITSLAGGATATLNLPEYTTAATTVVAIDADGDPLTYSISGGADAALFTIDASTGALSFNTAPQFASPADANSDNNYEVQVQVTDGSLTDTQDLTLSVTNVNDAPTITSQSGGSTAIISQPEGNTAATTITASDIDGDALTYSISGGADAALFTIDASTGALSFNTAPQFASPADADSNNNYEVQVQVTDGSLTDTQDLTVTITNVNDAPTITSTASISQPEGSTAVTTITASDIDGDPLTYSISGGADATLFTIDPSTGALSFNTAPQFANPADANSDNNYEVQVQVSDGSLMDMQDLTVTITNVNDAPTITSQGGSSTATLSLPENSTAVTTVTASDIDGDTLTYSISGGADAALFTIDASTGALSFNTAPQFASPADANSDNNYEVQVQVTDGSLTDTQDLTLSVTNVNDAPTITSQSGGSTATLSLPENSTTVTTVTASDIDGDPLTYSISGGADAALFTIDPSTGALSFNTAPQFATPADANSDNSYEVQVQVSDGSLMDTQDLTITITKLPEKVLEYSIERDLSGRYHVFMRPIRTPSTDLSLTGQITLTVPTGTGSNRFLVSDLQSAVANVSWVLDSRVDAPVENNTTDYLSFTFNPSGHAYFNWQAGVAQEVFSFINPSVCSGSVAIIEDSDPFNIPTNSMNTVPANQFTNLGWGSMTDNNYLDNYGSAVDCLNTNTAPAFPTPSASFDVSEGSTTVTTISATDVNNDPLTYGISGGTDAAQFTIDPSTGALSFVDPAYYGMDATLDPALDSNSDNIYEVMVSASDTQGAVDTQMLSISVMPTSLGIQVKAWLQGAYNSSTDLMDNALATLGLIPTTQPYTQLVGSSGMETVDSGVLGLTGNDAPVDWVLLEVRSAATPATVVLSIPSILQRDGDVVDASTGSAILKPTGLAAGDYYIAVRHRNHLGIITATPITLTLGSSILVDFSLSSVGLGSNTRLTSASNKTLLWAGDVNTDDQIIANGPDNEVNLVLSSVLLWPANTSLNANYVKPGYAKTDINMDGQTIFAGPDNDINLLAGNVLLHPSNTTSSANYVIQGSIPK
ncbi:Ig-like domain-containing protein [Thiofilum flexile]|uniref:Ig-like domain-containing protein n=1 Tax=Thiofilum flexile TaxID=125627 RepID=UPI00037635E8|nr:Ig-like domain-containing protein [Thiofilum flexile]